MSRSARPSLRSYISVDDPDEYTDKICHASTDEGTDNDVFSDDVMLSRLDITDTPDCDSLTEDSRDSKKKECCSKQILVLIIVIGILFVSLCATVGKMVAVISKCEKSDAHTILSPGTKEEQKQGKPGNTDMQCLLYNEEGQYTSDSKPLKDRCTLGSTFVKNYCPNTIDHSQHNCQRCVNGEKLLPNFCFCDVGIQCVDGSDAPRKKDCDWCIKFCPCLNNGTCKCCGTGHKSGDDISCICPHGYRGKYCELTPFRICNIFNGYDNNLDNCNGSLKDKCITYSNVFKTNVTCVKFKDKNVDENIKDCNVIAKSC